MPSFTTSAFNAVGAALQPVLWASDTALARAGVKRRPLPVRLPEVVPPQPETTPHEADAIVRRLHDRADAWVACSVAERIQLLRATQAACTRVGRALAEAGARAKGTYGSGIGEEWNGMVPVVMGMLEYIEALGAGGAPPPLALTQREGGQWVARVWPKGLVALLFPGFEAEVWIEPGKAPTQGRLYRSKAEGLAPPGVVSLVLGAGNQVPVVALDILHKLMAEDSVAVIKMNPVNDYAGPLLEQVFEPFVSRGFLAFAYGGRAVGEALVHHPLVGSVHLTGSADTYNAIVWGSPSSPRVGVPPLSKPVTAELGNVTPYLVVPGDWSAGDIDYHVDNVVSGLAHNAGHNCLALEVLVTDASWPQRAAFMARLRQRLDELPQRAPFYPGSGPKYAAFKARFPRALALGQPTQPAPDSGGGGSGAEAPAPVPWLLAEGLAPEEADTQRENWCGVMQEVSLPGTGGDPSAFLRAATAFANERCWGTLACSLIIHPSTRKAHAEAYEAALAGLRYGSVCVNCPTLMGFGVTALPWGAFPGSTPEDIGSGNSFVHNTSLFDHPQKGVITAPFRYSKPLWSVTNTNLERVVPEAVKLMAGYDRTLVAGTHLALAAANVLFG